MSHSLLRISMFFLISCFPLSLLSGQHGGGGSDDPLGRLNYPKAFDQTDLYEEFQSYLEGLPCWENIAPIEEGIEGERRLDHVVIPMEDQKAAFEAACLRLLDEARFRSITKPARSAGSLFMLMVGTTGGLVLATGADSVGGSFGIFALSINCVWFFKDIMDSGWDLKDPPAHPLDSREKQFAISMVQIPKAIWPALIEKFIVARTNPFSQREALSEIDFALGFTLYREKPTLQFVPGLLSELLKDVKGYFQHHKEFSDKTEESKLKANLARFLLKLANPNQISSRPLYLTGPGGIGKTHFAGWLNRWFQKHIPGSTQYQKRVIYTPEELKGSSSKPGAFLSAIRSVCKDPRATGAILFFDEANWLNDPTFNKDVKLTFDGEALGTLTTEYFGKGPSQSGMSFPMPPFLVLLAGNQGISDEDPALASRFDSVTFPMPTKDASKPTPGSLFGITSFIQRSNLWMWIVW
jgi:hypothetical protein